MAGSHANAAGALEIASRPRKRRDRRYLGIDIRNDSVGSKNGSGRLNKKLALVAAIARNGNGRFLKRLVEVIGKTLRRAADRVDVHTVGTGTDSSAQAGSTEREVLKERVGYLILVARLLHGVQLGEKFRILDMSDPGIEKLVHISHV